MPRASLVLILLVSALASCGREDPKPPPEPTPPIPAVQRIKEAPADAGEPALPPIDLRDLDEDAALVALMKHELTAGGDDGQPAFARFRPVEAEVLLDRPLDLLPEDVSPSDAAAADELDRASVARVEQQIPPNIRDAIRAAGKVKVLVVESCGADAGTALGIPDDFDEGSAQQYLDQARFAVAMEGEKLTPFPLPADFRDMEGDREAIGALNQRLFDLIKDRATGEILVVLDLSADCAVAERQVALVTEPAYESLRILPAFYHTVCEQRSEDSWAPEQCRWWREVTQPLTMDLGTYYYVATWPDGVEKRGRFVIDGLVTEAIEEGQDTLTLDIR